MSYERVYKGGTLLRAMVILVEPKNPARGIHAFLRYDPTVAEREITRSNGTIEVVIEPADDHFDSSDNTYYCKITEQGPALGHHIWVSFLHLVPIGAPNKKSDGMTCFECRNGYPMAEPNFEDKLVCWSCCDSLGWKYSKDKKTGKVTAK